MAWIDYQKAFDRVPQSWIIKSLELIGINHHHHDIHEDLGVFPVP
jgi:hypothetical protein